MGDMYSSADGNSQAICHACLSGDRALFPLGKYTDIYYTLFSNLAVDKLICWECAAILRKIKLFQSKVEHAQMLLITHCTNNQTLLPSLSSLTFTNVHLACSNKINCDTATVDKTIKIEKATDDTKHNKIAKETDVTQLSKIDKANNDKIRTELDVETDNKTLTEPPPLNHTKPVLTEEADDKEFVLDNVSIKEEYFDDDDFNDSNDVFDVKTEVEGKAEKKGRQRISSGVDKTKEFKLNGKVTRKQLKVMCKITFVEFSEVNKLLEREKKSDSYKSRHKCKSCVLAWPKLENLRRHEEKFHDVSRDFVCNYCKSTFKSKMRLKSHMTRHREVFECRSCGHRAAGGERMALHLAQAHRVSCNSCDSTFRSIRSFYRHYNVAHTLFICDICGRRCRMKRVLEKHMMYHYKQRCEICNIDFKHRKSYLNHVSLKHVESGGENAYCVECDLQFKNVTLFSRHMNTSVVHMKDKEGYKNKRKCACPECGKNYANRGSMRNHYNFVHLKQSNYVCKICDTQFLNRTKYVSHMRLTHEGKEKLKNKICHICGKGFSNNRILANHMLTHTGERPHACERCPARFTQLQALQSHVAHVHLRVKRKK